jgi:uncharacterized protein with HEPN domain
MPDELIIENLNGVADAIEMIIDRFSSITEADDFMMSPDGVLILDAICMRLQIIGELLKKIQKIDPSMLQKYAQIEWPKIMKLRDVISHHYDHVDHEIIFDICKNNIPPLKEAIQQILADQTKPQ